MPNYKCEERYLLVNKIETPDGTVLISRHRHDFNCHKDKNGFEYCVDGGTSYTRRVTCKDAPAFIDRSVFSDDSFELIRAEFERGGRGKDGKQPLTYVPLKDMSDAWLQATIDYIFSGREEYSVDIINPESDRYNPIIHLYFREQEYRAEKGIHIPDD